MFDIRKGDYYSNGKPFSYRVSYYLTSHLVIEEFDNKKLMMKYFNNNNLYGFGWII